MLVPGSIPSLQFGSIPLLVTDWPGAAVLPHQQLPVLVANESHQKSVPFGFTAPEGETPMTLPWKVFRYDVEMPSGEQPGIGVWVSPRTGPQTVASGTANSIRPRRQLL